MGRGPKVRKWAWNDIRFMGLSLFVAALGTAVRVTDRAVLLLAVVAPLETTAAKDMEFFIAKHVSSPWIKAGFAGQGIDSFQKRVVG